MKITDINPLFSINNPNRKMYFKSDRDNFDLTSSKFIAQSATPFKNNIDTIFSDIDGTISKCDDEVTQNVIDSINKIHKQGKIFIPVSARTYKEMLAITEQLDFTPDYYITLNGAQIIDKNGKIVYEHTIPQKCLREFVDWGLSFDVSNQQEGHFVCFFDNQPYTTDDFQFWWKSAIKNEKSTDFFREFINNGTKLQKAKIFKDKDETSHDFMKKVINSFNQKSFNDLCLHCTDLEHIEIFNKNASKSCAADFLLKQLSCPINRTMAIGDGENDIDLLRFIGDNGGLSVAMGNASQNVKDNCIATTLNIDNDGLSKAIDCLF